MAHIIPPSSSLAFGMQMSEKRKSVSPSAIHVKKQRNTMNTEDKLDIISQLKIGEQIFYISYNVRYTHISIRRIYDNADRIKWSAKSGTEVFV